MSAASVPLGDEATRALAQSEFRYQPKNVFRYMTELRVRY